MKLDARGLITNVESGDMRRWSIPGGNLRWGLKFALSAGTGTTRVGCADCADADPIGFAADAQFGAMIGPRLSVMYVFSVVASAEAALVAQGVGVQWWPWRRVWLRGVPALVIGEQWDGGSGSGAPDDPPEKKTMARSRWTVRAR